MGKPKALAWTPQEIAILQDVFPGGGINAAADALPDRSWQAINVMASKLGIRSGRVGAAPKARLQGDQLEEAIRLREDDGWSFEKIGLKFGVSESSARNAVLIALCPRKGFTPAQRDASGRLTAEGMERLHLALRKGVKAVDIQMRLGLSAERVAEERRRYQRDLKLRGKAPLPPAGAGLDYSGRKIPKARSQEVEHLFMEGFGAATIVKRTGLSNTHVGRIRNALVKRLARKGQCLPGCDINGVRHVQADSVRFIREEDRAALRELLLERVSVRRAALQLGIGACSAYRIRDQLAADLSAEGKELPKPLRLGNRREVAAVRRASWLPKGAAWIYRYRALAREHGPDRGKAMLLDQIAEEQRTSAARPRSFEEQLARVQAGARLVTVQKIHRPDPSITLGGISTGAL